MKVFNRLIKMSIAKISIAIFLLSPILANAIGECQSFFMPDLTTLDIIKTRNEKNIDQIIQDGANPNTLLKMAIYLNQNKIVSHLIDKHSDNISATTDGRYQTLESRESEISPEIKERNYEELAFLDLITPLEATLLFGNKQSLLSLLEATKNDLIKPFLDNADLSFINALRTVTFSPLSSFAISNELYKSWTFDPVSFKDTVEAFIKTGSLYNPLDTIPPALKILDDPEKPVIKIASQNSKVELEPLLPSNHKVRTEIKRLLIEELINIARKEKLVNHPSLNDALEIVAGSKDLAELTDLAQILIEELGVPSSETKAVEIAINNGNLNFAKHLLETQSFPSDIASVIDVIVSKNHQDLLSIILTKVDLETVSGDFLKKLLKSLINNMQIESIEFLKDKGIIEKIKNRNLGYIVNSLGYEVLEKTSHKDFYKLLISVDFTFHPGMPKYPNQIFANLLVEHQLKSVELSEVIKFLQDKGSDPSIAIQSALDALNEKLKEAESLNDTREIEQKIEFIEKLNDYMSIGKEISDRALYDKISFPSHLRQRSEIRDYININMTAWLNALNANILQSRIALQKAINSYWHLAISRDKENKEKELEEEAEEIVMIIMNKFNFDKASTSTIINITSYGSVKMVAFLIERQLIDPALLPEILHFMPQMFPYNQKIKKIDLLITLSKPSSKDEWGRTDLMFVAQIGTAQQVEFLIERGHDIYAKDRQRKGIEDYANQNFNHRKDILEILKKYGY